MQRLCTLSSVHDAHSDADADDGAIAAAAAAPIHTVFRLFSLYRSPSYCLDLW